DRGIGADVLVGIELHGAFFALELDRQDLILEVSLGLGIGSTLVTFDRERILVRASEPALGRDILGGYTHVHRVERIGERADHHVDVLGVTHARAPALRHVGVGGTAHALGAAG